MSVTGKVFTSEQMHRVSANMTPKRDVDANRTASFEVTYFNTGLHPLVVKSRFGVETYLEPGSNGSYNDSGGLLIRLTWKMSGAAFRRSLSTFKLDSSDSGDALNRAIIRTFEERWHGNDKETVYTNQIEVLFRTVDIMNNGDSAYLKDFDVTVCVDTKPQQSTLHPADRNYEVELEMGTLIPNISQNTLLVAIKAVDNNPRREYADRYMMIGDQAFHIPIEVDPGLPDGIHIWRRSTAREFKDKDEYEMNLRREHLSFKEADVRLGLHDSIEKAEHGGDKNNFYKAQVAEKTYERTIAELDRKEHVNKLDANLIQAKAEENRIKHHEEMGLTRSKTLVEWLRATVSMVTATVTVFALIAKLRSVK